MNMRKLPLLVFCSLVASALLACIGSCQMQAKSIDSDVRLALSQTLSERPSCAVDADTIRVYRSHITVDEVRDTAFISVRSVRCDNDDVTVFEAHAGYSLFTLLGMSDQRLAVVLASFALLWCLGCWWYRRFHPEVQLVMASSEMGGANSLSNSVASLDGSIAFGGLYYQPAENRFCSGKGTELRLTPMQHQLLSMFFQSPSHSLSKQDICQALWPKKPDATDTLYTLIRRLKPVIEEQSDLKIESDRGRAYVLKSR